MSEAIAVHHGAFGRAALYRLDRPFVTHAHREGHLIFYVDGGEATVHVGRNAVPVTPARAAAVSPWEPHSFAKREHSEPCTCLVMYIKPMWFLENSRSVDCVLDFGRPVIHVDEEVRRWVGRLTALLLSPQDSELMDGYLYEVTRLCFDQSWQRERGRALGRLRNRFSDYRVRRSLRLMQESFTEEVQMDELAREVGLSRPHFFKLFKMQMGITPKLYLNTLRAEHAIDALVTTEKSVTDIGHELGFSSQASFTRFFASNVGIAPSEYRRVAHHADASFSRCVVTQ
ncbi:MAG: AraC family transcriptional regulator [Alphaproteobacteria bacterium]|nr:MAG: AraC family transcriptional regulator [Alphaproteobacteria bacterium]